MGDPKTLKSATEVYNVKNGSIFGSGESCSAHHAELLTLQNSTGSCSTHESTKWIMLFSFTQDHATQFPALIKQIKMADAATNWMAATESKNT